MNVYDFDGTIYDGDSSVDFYWYALKKKPYIICSLPKQLLGFVLYALKRIDKAKLKSYFFSFLSMIDGQELAASFWSIRHHKIFPWYHQQKSPDDIVISASPEFLLQPICQSLGIRCLIASKVDGNSGAFLSANCYGEEKVRRFYLECGEIPVDHFYSDSPSDEPMASLAHKAYLVKNGKITNWPAQNLKKKAER